jgi:hypothetical protein
MVTAPCCWNCLIRSPKATDRHSDGGRHL